MNADRRSSVAGLRDHVWEETAREVFAEAVRRAPSPTVALTLGDSSEPGAPCLDDRTGTGGPAVMGQ
ncbi:hypothetical protein [Streptomyces sp. KMM 9044]|uniref:hypothetical protein n=1 Tax=Streptomyces sp. KMM 9044 TaxID=2744474 RepID=UPI0021511EB7|nr:hypothetical protein [Streptomyces sp. KMM 9044]WAX81083.1 hypothetical protein HUV60_028910 [Streptomyces sp. KMM 9044]